MSTSNAAQRSDVSNVRTVEALIEQLKNGPIKSMLVVKNLDAPAVVGYADDTDFDYELAGGVTYLVVGVGKLPNEFPDGVNVVDL